MNEDTKTIVISRLEQILKEQDVNKSKLAKLTGVTPQAVNNWFNRGNISKESASIIANEYGYHLSWIIGISDDPKPSYQLEADDYHKHRIDYLDVRAAAGMVEFSNSDYPEIISSLWLSDDGMLELIGKKHSDGIYLINVPTDSMEPTIKKGDIVFIDTKINHYTGDGVYAFVVNGSLYIKRLQKLISGDYKMISDNKIYEPEIMNSDVYATAQFVGKFIRRWHIDVFDL